MLEVTDKKPVELHTQLEEAVQEIEALYRATSFLIKTTNLHQLIEQIMDVVRHELGFPNCDIELVEESTGRLVNYGLRGRRSHLALRVDGPGLIALAVRTGEVVNAPDVHAHEHYVMALPETRSELVVPLKAEGKVIGVLNLESPQLNAFSEREVRVLTSFADRAALVIRQAQLHEQLQAKAREVEEQRERYQDLFDNLRDIVYTHDLQGRIMTINPAVKAILGYEPEEVVGRSVAEFIAPRFQMQFGDYLRQFDQSGQARGLLTLVGRDGQEHVFEYDNTLITDGNIVVGSRGIARDMTDRVKLEAQPRRRAEREVLINQISRRLHQSLEVDEILRQAVQELGTYLEADRCIYYRIDEPSGQLTRLHEYLKEGTSPALPSYQMSRFGDLVDLARQQMPIILDDLMIDPRTRDIYETAFRPVDTRSMLCIPLVNEGQLEGALVLAMVGAPRHWKQEEVELSSAVATQVAIAMRQAHLYQRLRRSEEMYRSIFENATEGIFQSTPDGHFLAVNPALAQMIGYDHPDELLALDITRDLWVDTTSREEYKREMERYGRVVNFWQRLRKRDGSVIIVKENARAVRDAQGHVLYHEGMLEDVTQQKQAEEELRQRNRELSTLYSVAMAISRDPSVQSVLHNTLFELTRVLNVPFGCIYIKRDHKFTLQSYRGFSVEETKRLAELDLATHPWVGDVKLVREPLSQPPDQVTAWEKARGIQAWVSVPLRSKNEIIGVIRLASRDEEHFTSANISLITGVASQVAMALENARLYEQMKASEEKYRSIFENVIVGLYQTSPEGKILTANPALVHLLGYDSLEELLSANILQDIYVNPEDRGKNQEVLHRTGQLDGVELRLRRKDGQEIIVLENARAISDADGQVRYYEGTLMDITEKKALEQQLLQAQKMESIGTLAGGIAHDFNNLLTGVMGYTSLILSQSLPSDRHYQNLLVIEKSARRGAELTEKLLAFSRQTMTQLRPTDLNNVVNETMTLLRRSLDASIEIEVNQEATLWTIEADGTQIQQVLMNLCINARDAMPNGGLLKLETANVVLDEAGCRSHVEARPGEFVVLRVSDTGVGIPPQNLPRIFDPFFSTKEVNKGTGLGLSTAYGIIKSHHGLIQVESQPGAGTRFSIFVPATQRAIRAPVPPPAKPVRGQETILVVDDEAIVRQLAKAILERQGYTVLVADGGPEALQIYQQQGDDIDLVILDLTMPKMNGRVCYQELRKLDPEVKVMLSSGYSADEAVQELLGEGVIRFMQKPYRVEDLTRAVREMLNHTLS
jgi:PAS domain S-box-containing protein